MTTTAYGLGAWFAEYLNERPQEAANWAPLAKDDIIPKFDYGALTAAYGSVSDAVDAEYKKGFNDHFKPKRIRAKHNERTAEIRGLLAQLELHNEHQRAAELNGDAITWSDVETLKHIENKLREIRDFALGMGEHA